MIQNQRSRGVLIHACLVNVGQFRIYARCIFINCKLWIFGERNKRRIVSHILCDCVSSCCRSRNCWERWLDIDEQHLMWISRLTRALCAHFSFHMSDVISKSSDKVCVVKEYIAIVPSCTFVVHDSIPPPNDFFLRCLCSSRIYISIGLINLQGKIVVRRMYSVRICVFISPPNLILPFLFLIQNNCHQFFLPRFFWREVRGAFSWQNTCFF